MQVQLQSSPFLVMEHTGLTQMIPLIRYPKQWNGEGITTTGGQQFTNKIPTVITDPPQTEDGSLVANGFEGKRP